MPAESLFLLKRVYYSNINVPDKAVKCFLKAGVPLAKVDCFENFLENAFRLTHSNNLSQLILSFMRKNIPASKAIYMAKNICNF